tara:strand:- start:368 stop:1081 length:714 start_codon:yes stop_codon:yes gene_type:complete
MSDLFPAETMNEEEIERTPDTPDTLDTVKEIVEEEKEEVRKEEDLDKPFIDEECDVEIKPKPKKKRKITEKQLAGLAKARESSRLKRMKLGEARKAESDAIKDEKKKKADAKRIALAEKKASQLAEIDAFQMVKDKKYSFTKDELNNILDQTIDRHEDKRKKRKEEQKKSQQPMVAQHYPYALPHVAVPQPYPIHNHPHQPPPISYHQMSGEQIRQQRASKETKKVDDFMNSYFNTN